MDGRQPVSARGLVLSIHQWADAACLRHCADWADAPGLPPLRGLRPPLRWGGEGERPGTAVKGGGGGQRPGTFAACGEVPERAGLHADSGEGGREC